MRFLRAERPASLVSQGRVYCRYSRADVDVDTCYACPSSLGMFTDGDGGTWVRCGEAHHPRAYR
jgi:hypothetical protein